MPGERRQEPVDGPGTESWPRRLEIIELERGSPEHQAHRQMISELEDLPGTVDQLDTAKSLREWRNLLSLQGELHGDVAEITHPHGQVIRFTLAPWRGRNEDTTLLRIRIVAHNPDVLAASGRKLPKADYDLTEYTDPYA